MSYKLNDGSYLLFDGTYSFVINVNLRKMEIRCNQTTALLDRTEFCKYLSGISNYVLYLIKTEMDCYVYEAAFISSGFIGIHDKKIILSRAPVEMSPYLDLEELPLIQQLDDILIQ